MHTKLFRSLLASAIGLALAFSGLTAAPAGAVDSPALGIPAEVKLGLGTTTAVPVTLSSYSADAQLTASIYVSGPASLAIDNYGELTGLTEAGGCASGCTDFTVSGSTSAVKTLLESIELYRNGDGTTNAVSLRVRVVNPLKVDPLTGVAYEDINSWNSGWYVPCAVKYTDAYWSQGAGTPGDCVSRATSDPSTPITPRVRNGVTASVPFIDSAAEAAFLTEAFNNTAFWLAGSDSATGDTWVITDGPAKGQTFWIGGPDGAAQNGIHTNWYSDQPTSEANWDSADYLVREWGGQWSAVPADWGYPTIVEYNDGSTVFESANLDLEENFTLPADFSPNQCLSTADGFDSVMSGDKEQGVKWFYENAGYLSDAAGQHTSFSGDSTGSSDNYDNSFFQLPYDGSWANACVSITEEADYQLEPQANTPISFQEGVTARIISRHIGNGMVRQELRLTNITGNAVALNDITYEAGYGTDEYEVVFEKSNYGVLFAGDPDSEETGLLTALWGGSDTTIVEGDRFADVSDLGVLTADEIMVAADRFKQWEDITTAYFDGIENPVINWGAGATDPSFDSTIGVGSDMILASWRGLSLAAGETKSVVVFNELQVTEGYNTPFFNLDSHPEYESVMQGAEVDDYIGMDGAEQYYTYSVSDGTLPTGLGLTAGGRLTGTVAADATPGEYAFTVQTALTEGQVPTIWEDFTSRSQTYYYTVVEAAENGSFESGVSGPWTEMNQVIDLGVTTIAGCKTIDTQDYSVLEDLARGFDDGDLGVLDGQRGGVEDNYRPDSFADGDDYTVSVTSEQSSNGSNALSLYSDIDDTRFGYDVVHGPAVYSPKKSLSAGQVIAFDWKAVDDSDAFAVYGYLLNTDTCEQTEVIDAVGESSDWKKAYAIIPAAGNYRMVFVSGTFDRSGGRAAGAYLYVDNFQYGNVVAPVIVDDVLVDGQTDTQYADAVAADAFPDAIISLVAGSLGDNMAISPAGAVTGTPVRAGQYQFKFKADNGYGSATAVTVFRVTEPAGDFAWTDSSLVALKVGEAVADGVATNLAGTALYSVVEGQLPDGLSLDPATGAIIGSPTTAGDYCFTVEATNGEATLQTVFCGFVEEGESDNGEGTPVELDDTIKLLPKDKYLKPIKGKGLLPLLTPDTAASEATKSALAGTAEIANTPAELAKAKRITMGKYRAAMTTVNVNRGVQVTSSLFEPGDVVQNYLKLPNGKWFDLGKGQRNGQALILPATKFLKPGRYVVAATVVATDAAPKYSVRQATVEVTPKWGIRTQRLVVWVIGRAGAYFAYDSAELTYQARYRLTRAAVALRGARVVKITGYTQTDVAAGPGNSGSTNLARKRANAVAKFLRSKGLKAKIEIKYYGAKLPASTKQYLNRRVEVSMVD